MATEPGADRFHRARIVLCSMGLLLLSTSAQAQLIDFETVPGGSPADQLAISDQYESGFGVTFGLDDDGNGEADPGATPFLELVGGADAGIGFANHQVGNDQADAGFESLLGSYFLRFGTGDTSSGSSSLLIVYSTPVSAASADLWDIDGSVSGTEQWSIQALDDMGGILETILSPEGVDFQTDPYEGRPWTWSFDRVSADIHAIRVEFVGTKTTNVGLAFDRFSPASASAPPEAPTVSPWLVVLTLAGTSTLLARRRR